LVQRIRARENRRDELEKRDENKGRYEWKERTANFTDEMNFKPRDRKEVYNITSNRPEIKVLDLSKVVKPALVNDPSEKSFIALKSYYESEADLNPRDRNNDNFIAQNYSPNQTKPKKEQIYTAPLKNSSINNKKDQIEGMENSCQLEFVEIPCTGFIVDEESLSQEVRNSSRDQSCGSDKAKNSEKIRQLSLIIERKDQRISVLEAKNEQLIEEVSKMKQQMARQIELLTSEVNQAKSMVLSTSTLLPSMPDTARSRSGRSPMVQSGLGLGTGSDSDMLHCSLVKEIAEVFLQLLNHKSTSDALKSFIEMSNRRIKASSDLYSALRSMKDLVTASIEGLDRTNVKNTQRLSELEVKTDKDKQKIIWLEDELCSIKWQNCVLNTNFENFQFITSTIGRSSNTFGRGFSTCSREYFEEVQRLLKKNLRRREPTDDDSNFSYMNSLVRQIADCIA
jgi:hypothetical protein